MVFLVFLGVPDCSVMFWCSGVPVFRVLCSVFRVPCFVFRVPCSVFRVPCSVFRVPAFLKELHALIIPFNFRLARAVALSLVV